MARYDVRTVKPMMARYAARYYLSGPDKDDLVERTLVVLLNDPDALADGPIEKSVAETMHRVFADQNGTILNLRK